nr:hypothetical protein [Candidatus Paceibacterota bacterium]
MNRKTFLTILIGIVTLVVVGIIAFLVISFWKGDRTGTTGSGFSLFPGLGGNSNQVVDGTETPEDIELPPGATLNDENVPRLRRLADFPVIALQSYTRPEKIIIQRIVEIPQEAATEPVTEEAAEETEIPTEEAPEQPLTETLIEVVDINQLYARYVRQDDGAVFTSKIANQITQKHTALGPIPYAGDSGIGNYGNSIVYRFFNNNSQTIETFIGSINENNI